MKDIFGNWLKHQSSKSINQSNWFDDDDPGSSSNKQTNNVHKSIKSNHNTFSFSKSSIDCYRIVIIYLPLVTYNLIDRSIDWSIQCVQSDIDRLSRHCIVLHCNSLSRCLCLCVICKWIETNKFLSFSFVSVNKVPSGYSLCYYFDLRLFVIVWAVIDWLIDLDVWHCQFCIDLIIRKKKIK